MHPRISAAAAHAASLTEAQKEALRHVRLHRQSKEIARELGISKVAVDKRIEAAVQRLGLTSRTDAALALSYYEHGEDYDRIIGDPVPLAATPQSGPSIRPVTGGPSAGLEFNEPAAAYFAGGIVGTGRSTPRERGDVNALSQAKRLGWIAGLALAILALALIALAVGQSISGMLNKAMPVSVNNQSS